MEAIVLAGGRGTRLQSVVNDVPKPMALVSGTPFLSYLLSFLRANGVRQVVLAVGYKNGVIRNFYGDNYLKMPLIYSVETEPLGTGGAIKQALELCNDDNIIIANGDTYFDVDLTELAQFHIAHNADMTVALKEMSEFDRYGIVEMNGDRINTFREKEYAANGYINGGVYCIKRGLFKNRAITEKFSYEQFMTDNVADLTIMGLKSNGNFIDIGVPEDYKSAQDLLPKWVS
jgi:D-glycero-alpha-D-manno-heptose 1-phosphate guanylyltransferase